MAVEPSQLALDRARRSFFERGGDPGGKVPELIVQSWRRCLRQGLPFDGAPRIEPVGSNQLREMRERHDRLRRLARAELDALASDAATSGSIVLLTDESGWILEAGGSTGFLDRASRVALMPGACWGENTVGTNAIGTAIIESHAIQVHGAEHYLGQHGALSCAAMPIFDPYGELVGVLDISGDARNSRHVHVLALVRMAVNNIEQRYFEDGIPGSELVHLHHDPALLGTPREGLLAFRNGKLVAANRSGLRLFGLDRSELGHAHYEGLFECSLSALRDEGTLVDRLGRSLYGRVEAPGTSPVRPQPTPSPSATPLTARRITARTRRQSGSDEQPLFDAVQETALLRACRVLDAELPVLVQGETGTGKEVFARELHQRCRRAGKPFIAVNCAALPETLIEAELFGYEEGAFTGARKHGSPGLLRQAEGGVLFLDEIGDMPLALQPRLLRVLQDRELMPLGGGKPVKLDFALICATHHDLDNAISQGEFRADLYYRIAHHTVTMPALRTLGDRRPLLDELWRTIGQGRRLTPPAFQALADYDWPGNLRQLSACLRTLAALSEPDAVLDTDVLPAYLGRALAVTPAADTADSETDLVSVTHAAMRQALDACDGNVSRAARQLGISRSTLYRHLHLGRAV